MSTGFYVHGKDNIGKGNISLTTDSISVLLVDTTLYNVDLSVHETQADIPEEAILSERTLEATSFVNGVFDGNDIVFPLFSSDSTAGAFIICKETDVLDTSLLIAYIDNAPEFPITFDGSDFTIQWDNGPDKIFKL